MSAVYVFGSLNADVIARVGRLPQAGETVSAHATAWRAGGKGANQAHAAAAVVAAGGRAFLVGCVGADEQGDEQRRVLAEAGVDVSFVRTVAAPTGLAMITVDDVGENTIVVTPGANACWPDDLVAQVPLVAGDVVVAPLEVSLPCVREAFGRARVAGATTVLNAAPVMPGVRDLLPVVDVLVVNETEFAELFGQAADAASVARATDASGPDLIVTRGAHGVLVAVDGVVTTVAAERAQAVDTVGAGDAFVGAFAGRLAAGDCVAAAVAVGMRVGALTVTVPGARYVGLAAALASDLGR